jgi:hypothetical protein
MQAYLDESGDLGFTRKSTKHFVITLLVVNDEKGVHKCIKDIRVRKLKKRYRKIPELKFNNSSDFIKRCVLGCLSKKDIEVYAIVLKKSSVYDHLHDHKNKIYNYLTKFLVERIVLSPADKEMALVVDRFMSRETREDYNHYIKDKLAEIMLRPIKIEIRHMDSQQDKCLQATDFISGSIFNKYEFGNEKYYSLIESRIKSVQVLFGNR